MLWQPQVKAPKKNLPTEYALRDYLSLLENLPSQSNFVFVGNGMYIPYLSLKGAFKDTALFHRIFFLSISRGLAHKLNEDFFLQDYLSSIKIDKSFGPVVVIDSLSRAETYDHSLFDVSAAIRRYFHSLSQRREVISLGIPESGFIHSYGEKSLSLYREKLHKFPNFNFRSYLFSPVSWETMGLFYEQSNLNKFYWSGKFSEIDTNGFPTGTFPARSIENQENLALFFREVVLHSHQVIRKNKRLEPKLQTILEAL